MALASIALAHAKAELARSGRNSAKIAMHVLSWLSCGPQLYVPIDDKSAVQLPRSALQIFLLRIDLSLQESVFIANVHGLDHVWFPTFLENAHLP